MHIAMEIGGALIALVPIVGIARAYRDAHSRRLALALTAFIILEARLLGLVLLHTLVAVDHYFEEVLDFGGDLAVITAFAMAFLYGTRWSFGRIDAEHS